MLVLTSDAVDVVSSITARTDAPDAAGLRIAAAEVSPKGANLSVELVSCPLEGDQIVAQTGARVYMDAAAAAFLDDKVLTADLDILGQPHFKLFEPGSDDRSGG